MVTQLNPLALMQYNYTLVIKHGLATQDRKVSLHLGELARKREHAEFDS